MKPQYQIRPIRPHEWLPDRCMPDGEPLDPARLTPQCGCPSLSEHCEKFAPSSREKIVSLYEDALARFGCCGFVAWAGERVAGYINFFPREIANNVRFYGWGTPEDTASLTFFHNCISIPRNSDHRRKGIGTALLRHSLQWGKDNGWKRMEVHFVLPEVEGGFAKEQKSGQTFWEKLGFHVFKTIPACDATKKLYGVDERYSMAVDLTRWNE